MNEKQKENSKRIVSKWIILFSGVAAGFVFCGLIMFKIMPSMMIVTEECNFDFDRTVSELEKRVVENGWVLWLNTELILSLVLNLSNSASLNMQKVF
jgi:hypothetical protein